MTIFPNILFIEGGLAGLLLFLLIVNTVSQKIQKRHQETPEKISKPEVTPVISKPSSGKKSKNLIQAFRNDINNIYFFTTPRFYQSSDGQILYTPIDDVKTLTMDQIAISLLSRNADFLKLLKGEITTVPFDPFSVLSKRLTTATLKVRLKNNEIIPPFTKQIMCWKLPLVEQPIIIEKQKQSVEVEEV